MAQRTWLITGVSSGFGRELTQQLLERGDRVVGTVRDTAINSAAGIPFPDTSATVTASRSPSSGKKS